MKKFLKIFTGAVLVMILVAVIGGSMYMLNFSLARKSDPKGESENRLAFREHLYPELKPWIDSLQHIHALRDTFIIMPTGERHHAFYVWAPHKTAKTAIIVHGYKDRAEGMMYIARIYGQMGYNILLPDLHAHGRSEGSDIQMGWKDRKDVLHWCAVADSLFADSTGHTRQVLHGVSMGAATVMCVSGEKTPAYIKCFVEDCGYTSVWDEFKYEVGKMFGLPAFPLMYTTSALCKLCHGWTFGEASPLRQVAKCHKPMLFIHGDNDDFVPSWMVHPLYKAKPQPKELYIGHGSSHAQSYHDHKKAYIALVHQFAGKFI